MKEYPIMNLCNLFEIDNKEYSQTFQDVLDIKDV